MSLQILDSIWDLTQGTNYVYQIEFTSLIFLLIVSGNFFFRKKFPTPVSKLFFVSLIVAMVDIILNLIGAFLIAKIDEVPAIYNMIINGAFYICQIAIPILLVSFVIYSAGRNFKEKRLLSLLIPAIISVILLLLNPIHNLFFSIENEGGANSYVHGPLFSILYVNSALYLVLTLILLLIFKKEISKPKFNGIIILVSVVTSTLVIQIFVPKILLTGLGITIAMYVIFETLANPEEMVDKITGDYNMNALMEYLDNKKASSKNNYYIMLRIEDLKSVSEIFGLTIIADLRRQIGEFLSSIDKKVLIFRSNSNKYIINANSKEQIEKVKEAIENRFSKTWKVNDHKFELQAYGICMVNNNIFKTGEEYIEFISNANTGLELGEKHFIDFDEELLARGERNKKVVKIIKEALENNGFKMVYQPLYSTKENRFVSAEALIRIKSSEIPNLGPGEFIPIAEHAGLANKIDLYVANAVCKFLSEHPEVPVVEMNISCAEFFNNPSKQFIDIINKYNIDAKRLVIEITETVASKNQEKAEEFMNDLGKVGVRFALDDFGTGYANFSRIINEPFSAVKLDRSLLENSDKVKKLFKSSVQLFKSIDMPIVLEGVETKEQLDIAVKYKIEFIQGYYFSKPLDESDYLKFIKDQK